MENIGLKLKTLRASRGPKSTLVLDENGAGLKGWDLSKKGFALAILDKQGSVLFFTQQPMAEGDLENMVNLVKSQIGG